MQEVEKYLEKAEATLKDARNAYKQDMLVSTIQNRIYYAIYYSAQAALISVGCDAGTHEGVKIKIGEELILKNHLDKKWGRFFSQQQTYREQADYEVDVDIERKDLEGYLNEAETFIDEMQRITEE